MTDNITEMLSRESPTLFDLNSDGKQARAIKFMWEAVKQINISLKELKDTGLPDTDINKIIQEIKDKLDEAGDKVYLADKSKIDSLFI